MQSLRPSVLLAAIAALATAACSGSAGSRDADANPDAATVDAAPACAFVAGGDEPTTVMGDLGTLGGTLAFPDRCGPVPVVLIVSGGGTTDRNGNALGDPERPDLYHLLSVALVQDSHVAVARYDDEGIGASVRAATSRIEDFRMGIEVDDVAAEVRLLRGDPRFSSVILAGHSEGSLTALLAARAAPIDAFISLEGAGRPAGQVLHDQVADELTTDQMRQVDAAIAVLATGMVYGALPSPLDQILPLSDQPYLASYMPWDPQAVIATFLAPTLIVQGTTDRQVSMLDANDLLAGRPDAQLVVIPDMAHTLKQATSDPTSQHAAYYDPTVPLAAGLSDALHAFLARNGAPASAAQAP